MARIVVLLAAVLISLGLLAAPAYAQTPPAPAPSPSPSSQSTGGSGFGLNPFTDLGLLSNQISQSIMTDVGQAVESQARKNVRKALAMAQTATTTPDFADNQAVVTMWEWALGIINGAAVMVLVLSLIGLGSMVPEVTGWSVKTIIPRMLAGWLFADVSLGFLYLATRFFNALTSLFNSWLPASGFGTLAAASAPWLLTAFVGVLAIVLVITTIVRVVLLVILAVAGPWAQLTIVTPQSANVARVWWRMVFFLLISAPLQMLTVAAMTEAFLGTSGKLLPGTGALVDAAVLCVGLLILIGIPVTLIIMSVKPAVRVVTATKRVGESAAAIAIVAAAPAVAVASRAAAPVGPALSRVGRMFP